MSYYAVAVGRKVGVFTQPWSVVCEYVKGFSGAVYKKFTSRSAAVAFIEEHTGGLAEDTKKATGGPAEATEDDALRSGNLPGLHIYTDGGFRKKVGSSAFIAVLDGDEVYRKGKFLGHASTNNTGELRAIRMAFRYLSTMSEDQFQEGITIHSDSQYSIGVITGTMTPEKNLDIVLPLKEWYSDARPYVRLEYIPAHSGYKWNEEVDALCTKMIEKGLSAE